MEDVFCSREKILPTIFHETEKFMFVYDKYPIVKGHMLIIPKRHVEDIINLNEAEWKDLQQLKNYALPKALSRYCEDGRSYNIAMQVGKYSGREINHLHMHIIPRNAEDIFKGSPRKLYSSIVDDVELRESPPGIKEEVKALRKLFKYKTEQQ